jgi:hypothetical protein
MHAQLGLSVQSVLFMPLAVPAWYPHITTSPQVLHRTTTTTTTTVVTTTTTVVTTTTTVVTTTTTVVTAHLLGRIPKGLDGPPPQ